MNQTSAIELVGIDKKFGAIHANKNINLTVAKALGLKVSQQFQQLADKIIE